MENQTKIHIVPPHQYAVIFFNDDFTPMDFVVEILVEVFSFSIEEAFHLTMKIHQEGKAIVKIYNSKEIAETKVQQVNTVAQKFQHPLLSKLEKID